MLLGMDRLIPVEWSIYGFSGGSIRIEGRIYLPLTLGTEPHQKTIMQTFLVVKVPSTYNTIIGRLALNQLEAVVSTPHFKIKFSTKSRVGEVRARNCYVDYVKVVKKAKESLQIAGTNPRSDDYLTHGEPVEELTQIPLFGEDDERTVQIDMPGIPTDVAVHRLSVDPSYKPVKQNKWNFTPERQKVMPFSLKNAGVTYQWLVNKIIASQIGRNTEVYVDDMLVKSLKATSHVTNLHEAFTVLPKYQMKLNPSKCAFGVTSGKFLRFMVSQRGIEANPEKYKPCLT
ncbi:uncharacterized protein LOC143888687 [Tasmannia lanceolata]|uniref:uncharacterized protein LOC143888687 n=1 Tax=Tasmannia lanceolata TaxID=3420 RepID=UPI004064BAB4